MIKKQICNEKQINLFKKNVVYLDKQFLREKYKITYYRNESLEFYGINCLL